MFIELKNIKFICIKNSIFNAFQHYEKDDNLKIVAENVLRWIDRTPKNWCLQTVVLEKTPESSLDSKEIKLVHLKGDQPWIFTAWTDAEAEL